MEQKSKTDPKFTTRFMVYDEKRRRELESASGSALIPEEQLMVLEDYLHISLKRRHDPFPLFKLQLHLLQDIVAAERDIAAYKQSIEDRRTKVAAGVADKEQLEEEIRRIERELHFLRAECRAIRDIVDGIAWRLLDYDRAALYVIASRPSSKHINLEGLMAELDEFSHTFNSREGIAILCDLTHFLKLGDILVRKGTGTFELIEVKKGHKTSGTITRQKQDLRRTIEFLNTGEQEEEHGRVVIREVNIKPQTFHTNVHNIIKEAEKKGAIVERIGEHLVVECVDFTAMNKNDFQKASATFEETMEIARKWVQDWRERGDQVDTFKSFEKYADVRNFAPFSVYPLPELARVKLMTGALWLVTHLNISALLRYFEQRGWKVIKTPDEHLKEGAGTPIKNLRLITLQKGPLTSEIPPALIGRLGYEFLKPRTIVDLLETHLASGPADAGLSFSNFSGEHEIWD